MADINNVDDLPTVKTRPDLYFLLSAGVLLLCTGLLIAGFLLWKIVLWGDEGSFVFNAGYPLVILPILYVLFSIRKIKNDQRGVILSYGISLKNVGPGLHFVARGVMNRETEAIDIKEVEEPGPRNNIFWGDEKEPLPPEMIRPIFVNSRSQEVGEDRALDVQMQYGLGYYFFWRPSDDIATYKQNTRSIEEGTSQLKKLSMSLIQQIIGERTTEGVIASQENVNNRLLGLMRKRAKCMGIMVTDAGLTDINLSHDMATAMRDRAKAKFEAETLNISTDAQANNIRKMGDAEGDALKAKAAGPLLGRAEGMKKIKTELEVSGDAVLAHESVREALQKSTVIAGASGGMADLMGMVKATQTVLKNSKSEEGAQP